MSNVIIKDLESKLLMVQKERDDLAIKLHQARSTKKTFSHKLKRSEAYHESYKEATKLCVDFTTHKKIIDLTTAIYLGQVEKENCECNPNGSFMYTDERCSICHGLGYAYTNKVTGIQE